jgi:hypothetical protein
MADFFKIKIDADAAFRDLPKVTKAATANALNFTARKVAANLKKSVSSNYNIPKSALTLGKLISIKRANAQANVGRATIFVRKQGRGLYKYGAKQVAAGVSVVVKRAARLVRGAHISPVHKGSSEKFVFAKARGEKAGKIVRRSKKGTPYLADKRQVLYGASIAQLYTNRNAEKIILETIDAEFQMELTRQFNAQFEKKIRRRR